MVVVVVVVVVGVGSVTGLADHFANNITGEVMAKVSPGTYDVPVPSAFVFQPAKKNPVFVIDPVSPRTVTVEPEV